ncbi:MAG: DUF721 domain-containing protein [Flavobacteriales bacterium]|jgi:hypothetical protein|nr:DUF721 domain-containing protein [Flavobacteriales bacterium]
MKKRRFGYSNSISAIIEEMAKRYRWNAQTRQANIQVLWEKIADKELLASTERIHLENNVLYVSINNSSLKFTLRFRAKELLNELNKHLEDLPILEIRFI